MPTDSYPLHPDQAQPYYMTIPVEEYESIMRENKLFKEENARLNEVLKRYGITLLKDG
jgi:hypothetical protein